MSSAIHVSVKAEPILDVFGFAITNSLILSWVVMAAFLALGMFYVRSLHRQSKPGLFYVVQLFFMFIYDLIKSVLHDKVNFFYPLLAAYFFYILSNNWAGMLPSVGSVLIMPTSLGTVAASSLPPSEEIPVIIDQGHENEVVTDSGTTEHKEEGAHSKIPLFRSNNADLNATLALALITVFMVQYYGFKFNGLSYLKKFFNFSSPIMAFVGILELISEFARILSFTFRLFGNVLAGEILVTIVAALLPPVASFMLMPFFVLEIMAGAIQALVFTMISTVLISMATQKAHH